MFLAIGLVLITGTFLLFWPRLASSAISSKAFNAIGLGMTKGEVRSILGKPRRDVRPKDQGWVSPDAFAKSEMFWEEWWGREGVIRIYYDAGLVAEKTF